MTQKNNGGPAFPKLVNGYTEDGTGLTLRDWFAGQALMGFCADGILIGSAFSDTADKAYYLADAMLRARDEA